MVNAQAVHSEGCDTSRLFNEISVSNKCCLAINDYVDLCAKSNHAFWRGCYVKHCFQFHVDESAIKIKLCLQHASLLDFT